MHTLQSVGDKGLIDNVGVYLDVSSPADAGPSGQRHTIQPRPQESGSDAMLLARLHEIIEQRSLTALFQPVIDMRDGEIAGYEGLIRGPSDSPLHAPANLFKTARANGLSVQVEHLCRRVVIERFADLKLPGNLFLNVSPEMLLQPQAKYGETLHYIHEVGIHPERVIIELTENEPTYDYALLRDAVRHYRGMGFRIAIDDLGEGFSSLRLWSELRPQFVKIDMHFVQGINQDPVKLQFVRSIQEIAEQSGTLVIAEGIETEAEFSLIRDLGIAYGQGYHIARPQAVPATTPSAVTLASASSNAPVYPYTTSREGTVVTAQKLLRVVPIAAPHMTNNDVCDLFNDNPELATIPVVEDGVARGLIARRDLVERFARLYLRELYGRKPCTAFMDAAPLIVDVGTSIEALSQLMVEGAQRHLANGFIISERGRYAGMGTGQDLMREITRMQINAARYANPLTLLPGSVPIDEHIDRLLHYGARFVACYIDLDHFKAYNDVHGYRRGDEVIQLTARVIAEHCEPDKDFVGHIGGDDFIVLFQSTDWEQRCRALLKQFELRSAAFFSEEERRRGGYVGENRRGESVLHALLSLSIGVVEVDGGRFLSHHHIATAAAEAKREAKKIAGNSLFVERRRAATSPSQDGCEPIGPLARKEPG